MQSVIGIKSLIGDSADRQVAWYGVLKFGDETRCNEFQWRCGTSTTSSVSSFRHARHIAVFQ
jgi:hypothetical protein